MYWCSAFGFTVYLCMKYIVIYNLCLGVLQLKVSICVVLCLYANFKLSVSDVLSLR